MYVRVRVRVVLVCRADVRAGRVGPVLDELVRLCPKFLSAHVVDGVPMLRCDRDALEDARQIAREHHDRFRAAGDAGT